MLTKMKYFFITTKHLENSVWFREEEDYKVGMNKVALVSGRLGIKIISFILMSNHVHYLISCTNREEAKQFIDEFKNQYSRYVRHKYGIKELLRRNAVDIQEVKNINETLERVVAYIHMNCVAANLCSHPVQYNWGSGCCIYTDKARTGFRADSLCDHRRKKLYHSSLEAKPDNLIGDDGYVLPESFVDVEYLESLFHTPKRYNYFLNSSSKAKRSLETGDMSIPNFKDPVLISAISDLCQSLFQKSHFSQLIPEEKSELLKQLRYRFSSNIQQLARVTGLSLETVCRLLDKV